MNLKKINTFKVKITVYIVLGLLLVSFGFLFYFNGSNPFLVYVKNYNMPGQIISLNKEFELGKSEIAHLRNEDLSFYFYFQDNEIITQFILPLQATQDPDKTPYNLETTSYDLDNYTASFIISKK